MELYAFAFLRNLATMRFYGLLWRYMDLWKKANLLRFLISYIFTSPLYFSAFSGIFHILCLSVFFHNTDSFPSPKESNAIIEYSTKILAFQSLSGNDFTPKYQFDVISPAKESLSDNVQEKRSLEEMYWTPISVGWSVRQRSATFFRF